jgi:hypothetical protein
MEPIEDVIRSLLCQMNRQGEQFAGERVAAVRGLLKLIAERHLRADFWDKSPGVAGETVAALMELLQESRASCTPGLAALALGRLGQYARSAIGQLLSLLAEENEGGNHLLNRARFARVLARICPRGSAEARRAAEVFMKVLARRNQESLDLAGEEEEGGEDEGEELNEGEKEYIELDAKVGEAVATGLGCFERPSKRAFSTLRTAFHCDLSHSVRLEAAFAYWQIAKKSRRKEVLQDRALKVLFHHLSNDSNPRVRALAATRIGAILRQSRNDGAILQLMVRLADVDDRVRTTVFGILNYRTLNEWYSGQLADALRQYQDFFSLAHLGPGLSSLGTSAAVAVLDLLLERVELSNDECFSALCSIGGPAMEFLIKVLQGNEHWVKERAERVGLKEQVDQAFSERLQEELNRTKELAACAIRGLARRKPARALDPYIGRLLPVLQQSLQDRTGRVAVHAAMAIWCLYQMPDSVEMLSIRILTHHPEGHPRADIPDAHSALVALARIVADETRERAVRQDAADALGWIGPPAACVVPILDQVLQDKNDHALVTSVSLALAKINSGKFREPPS